ncbi:hypothetical protein CC1G_13739 [Coprinopsis cinerea okayama7|uniref:Heat shock factor binding protein 1 n=1 Tax=Coprinopsis cinerea (strain Okayama-7 / 130 / ATCC MYA-4618 / FGSC 9003) TaxID=240176 RepID=D6RJR2_COPC7|nr:hypothetical protein CC1G_13739 [Coprinopsis cinerea okayama7\|eukprot:XP_002912207.1 hypothetical protein CC1G_13739 [Coprinopsis cinerea okayama7\
MTSIDTTDIASNPGLAELTETRPPVEAADTPDRTEETPSDDGTRPKDEPKPSSSITNSAPDSSSKPTPEPKNASQPILTTQEEQLLSKLFSSSTEKDLGSISGLIDGLKTSEQLADEMEEKLDLIIGKLDALMGSLDLATDPANKSPDTKETSKEDKER